MSETRRDRGIGAGAGEGPWRLMLLLAVAVAVPTACVLWFMTQAMRNARLAVRQKLIEAYRPGLLASAEALDASWQRAVERLSETGADVPAPERFAMLVTSDACDGVVIYDATGRLIYPAEPEPAVEALEADSPEWAEAGMLEHVLLDPAGPAETYAAIAETADDAAVRARALLAQARCRAAANEPERAIDILTEIAMDDAYREARDSGGRLVAPLAGLRAVELMPVEDEARRAGLVDALVARVNDYSGPAMSASQRRFLMRRLRDVRAGRAAFATLRAEELAAEYLAQQPTSPEPGSLVPSGVEGVWRLSTEDGTLLALLRDERLFGETGLLASGGASMPGTRTELPSPTASLAGEPFLSVPLGGALHDWRLALFMEGADPFSTAAEREVAVYLWASMVSIGAVVLVALAAGRYLLRQTKLTRLKNDFIATVTHELKTPLSSVRLFAETLREGRYESPEQAGRYLDLLVKENERLSRLIDNFLSFSRMERNKRAFDLDEVSPGEVIETAAGVVRQRFESAGCRFEVDVQPDLPSVSADRDALVTVLLNLLDNAFKYTGEGKRIVLRAYASDGNVCMEVEDNGIGMSPRAARKAFDRFYQADSTLSRSAGGCGLGLSIVKFIVDAHGGSIDVRSEPGEGSTFTVRLPAATP